MGKPRVNKRKPVRTGRWVTVGRIESIPAGRGATVKLNDSTELALFNIGGKLYAIENFCPHKGYPLADSRLYGHIAKCNLHGWLIDVKTGHCRGENDCAIEKYEVSIEDGWIKIEI